MSECSCDVCRSACSVEHGKPGRFLPHEVAQAAALKGLSVPDFFNKYCGVEGPLLGADDVYFWITPAITTMKPGAEYPAYPRGGCVFHTADGRCDIHAAKPYECRETMCCEDTIEAAEQRQEVLDQHWNVIDAQRLVRGLLGRAPKFSVPTRDDLEKAERFYARRIINLLANIDLNELDDLLNGDLS